MFAACPSLTPRGLSLGPTHPGRINLPQEPLGLRRADFSSALSLLIPTFSLPLRPARLIDGPSSYRGTLPYPPLTPKGQESHSVGDTLSPDHCWRRIARPVSCYALFK